MRKKTTTIGGRPVTAQQARPPGPKSRSTRRDGEKPGGRGCASWPGSSPAPTYGGGLIVARRDPILNTGNGHV